MSEVPAVPARYEVLRELARGGMGCVYLAHDRHLDRPVAVKTFLRGQAGPRLQARFLEEAQVTGQLAHPAIVPVHELGGEGEGLFLVMKLVEGRTLKELLEDLRAEEPTTVALYPPRRLLRLFLKVTDAIGYAHGRSVIHRDLKPANVMVDHADQVLVMDWGLAKPIGVTEPTAVDPLASQVVRSQVRSASASFAGGELDVEGSADLTQAGSVIGTPAYMPLEQADGGGGQDERADVYSLGSILYELLTLRPPYRGSHVKVLSDLARRPPLPPRRVDPGVPPALEAIVLQAMARDAAGRYPDAAALGADLQRYLDGEAVEAYREGPVEALRRLVTRHKVASLTALAALVLVNVVALVAAALVARERGRLEENAVAARDAAAAAAADEARAEDASSEAEVAVEALPVAGAAGRVVERFEREAHTLLPLERAEPGDDGGAEAPARTLADVHREARAALAELRAELADRAASDRVRAAALGPFVAEVEAARRQLDLAMAEVLLWRDPAGLADGGASGLGLELGPAGALVSARALLRLGRPGEARAALARLDVADPALQAAGRALLRALDPVDPALQEEAFDLAVDLSPARGWLYVRRAEARARRGDLAGAEADYDQAGRLTPLDAAVHVSRWRHVTPIFAHQHLSRSVADLVAQIAPGDPWARLIRARGGLWYHGGAWKGIEAAVAETTEARPELEPAVLAWAAEMALVVRRLDRAEELAAGVLAAWPDDRAALGVRAEVRLRRDEPEAALALADEGLARYPFDRRLAHVRGRALHLLGRSAEAIPALEQGARSALEPEPWRHLAEALAAGDDPADLERAVEAVRRGMRHDPIAGFHNNPRARPPLADPRLHRLLGRLRLRQRRPAEAALHFTRAYLLAQNGRNEGILGRDLQDALHAGEAHEAMGLPGEALVFYEWAAADEDLAEEAARRIERLTGGR